MIPEWAALALLLGTFVMEVVDLASERWSQKTITTEECTAFCGLGETLPKTWGPSSCECHPRATP